MTRSVWRVPVTATLVAVTGWAGLTGYGWVHGRQVLDPTTAAALSPGAPVNLQVRLGFRPEPFNRAFLAEYGSPGAIRGRTITVFNVGPDGVRAIARQYWVDRITILGR